MIDPEKHRRVAPPDPRRVQDASENRQRRERRHTASQTTTITRKTAANDPRWAARCHRGASEERQHGEVAECGRRQEPEDDCQGALFPRLRLIDTRCDLPVELRQLAFQRAGAIAQPAVALTGLEDHPLRPVVEDVRQEVVPELAGDLAADVLQRAPPLASLDATGGGCCGPEDLLVVEEHRVRRQQIRVRPDVAPACFDRGDPIGLRQADQVGLLEPE